MQYCFFRSEFVPADRALLPVDDLALLRGYGVFDFFRVEEGSPVFLRDHLQRLAHSASVLGLQVPLAEQELEQRISELIRMNALRNGGVRITLTGGSSPDGFLPGAPALIITTQPVSWHRRTEGLRLKTFTHQRQLPLAKTIDYLVPIRAWPLLREEGFDDLLYTHEHRVSECSRANLFIVSRDGKLITSNELILEGVTRKKILHLAEGLLPAEVRPLAIDEVLEAAEVFVSSTTKELTAVRQVNDQAFDGPMPWFNELQNRFSALRRTALSGKA